MFSPRFLPLSPAEGNDVCQNGYQPASEDIINNNNNNNDHDCCSMTKRGPKSIQTCSNANCIKIAALSGTLQCSCSITMTDSRNVNVPYESSMITCANVDSNHSEFLPPDAFQTSSPELNSSFVSETPSRTSSNSDTPQQELSSAVSCADDKISATWISFQSLDNQVNCKSLTNSVVHRKDCDFHSHNLEATDKEELELKPSAVEAVDSLRVANKLPETTSETSTTGCLHVTDYSSREIFQRKAAGGLVEVSSEVVAANLDNDAFFKSDHSEGVPLNTSSQTTDYFVEVPPASEQVSLHQVGPNCMQPSSVRSLSPSSRSVPTNLNLQECADTVVDIESVSQRSASSLMVPAASRAPKHPRKNVQMWIGESAMSDAEAEDEETELPRERRRRCLGIVPHLSVSDDVWVKDVTAHRRSYVTIPDPSNQKLNWTKPPLTVLIIRKHLDETVLIPFKDLVLWLMEKKNMVVYVEEMVLEERILLEDDEFQRIQDKLISFKEGVDDLTDKIDFIICLGGDGTLLYVSSLFQGSVPPVMAFNMGSLGFLTPFQFYQDFKHEVTRVMQGSASLLLRFRLKCVVVKQDTTSVAEIPHVKNIQKEHVSLKTHKLVLNEVVIDRGSSSYLSNLDLFIEGRRVTTVQGDGLIISTPTGSTAYAVAAGASMIHPSVPCILLTPICPHSLSFRPIVVPAGVEIKVMLSPGSRGTAMVSFDGRDRQEIHQGDSLRITTASYPVPSICAADQIEDWFDGLAVCLNWNLRLQQRPLQCSSSGTSMESLDSECSLSFPSSQPNGAGDKATGLP